MIILALDPNTVNTGYVLYDDSTSRILASGTISSPASKVLSLSDRMIAQRTELEAIIAANTAQNMVDFAFVEGIFFGRNPSLPINLGLLTGILIGGMCKDFGRIPVTTWRLRSTGSGKKDYNSAIKDAWKTSKSFAIAKAFLGKDPGTEHEMDATGILIAYITHGKYSRPKKRK